MTTDQLARELYDARPLQEWQLRQTRLSVSRWAEPVGFQDVRLDVCSSTKPSTSATPSDVRESSASKRMAIGWYRPGGGSERHLDSRAGLWNFKLF